MSLPPRLPTAENVDGTETLIGRKGNSLFRFPLALIKSWMAAQGAKGDTGPGYTFQRATSAQSNSQGVASVKFATPFPVIPEVLPVLGVINSSTGPMLVFGVPSNVTKNGCDVTVYRSRGTLLLQNTPFELVSGASVSVVAFGTVA